jgi:hypothetical protein
LAYLASASGIFEILEHGDVLARGKEGVVGVSTSNDGPEPEGKVAL